ncbi:MAG: VWA domain-containing protein [Chloroflexi bacterium]|nr:VWA domain-containing protein [Chloroflexota bacterium]
MAVRAELEAMADGVARDFQLALTLVSQSLSADQVASWAELSLEVVRRSRRTREVAAGYFHASPRLMSSLSQPQVARWAELGVGLVQDSGALAGAYFRASAEMPDVLAGDRVDAWLQWGRRLHYAHEAAGPLAVRFFQHSPALLRSLATEEVDHFVILLKELCQHSADLALTVCDLAASHVGRIEALARQQYLSLLVELSEQFWALASARYQAHSGYPFNVTGYPYNMTPEPTHGSGLLPADSHEEVGVASLLRPVDEAGRALSELDHQHHAEIVRLGRRVGQVSAAAAVELLKRSIPLVGTMGIAGLDRWCAEGEELLRHSGDAQVAYFAAPGTEVGVGSREQSAPLALEDVRQVLHLYCQALSGRVVQVVSTEELARRGIGWVRSERPTTEGTAIYAPPEVSRHPSLEENFTVYKVMVAHQVGHLEFGTFRFAMDSPAALFPSLRPYLAESDGRRTLAEFERYFDLFADRQLAGDLFSIAEDTRVDAGIRREYPGLRAGYRRVQGHELGQRDALWQAPLRESVVEILARLSAGGDTEIMAPFALHPTLEAAAGLIWHLQSAEATVADAAEAALRLYATVRRVPNVEPDQIPSREWRPVDLGQARYRLDGEDHAALLLAFADANAGTSCDLDGIDASDGHDYSGMNPWDYRGEMKPELVQTLTALREGQQLSDDVLKAELPALAEALKGLLEKSKEIELPPALQTSPMTLSARFIRNLLGEAGKGMPHEKRAARQRRQPVEAGLAAEGDGAAFLYDEWDFRARSYKPNWCRLWERVGEEGSVDFFDETLKSFPGLVQDVRRQFELLRAERLRKQKRLYDGQEFDLDAVIDSVVDRRAGQVPDEKIYWRRNKIERDVAVALLLDMSVSTDERIDTSLAFDRGTGRPTPWRGKRIIDLERESLVLLIRALELIGDRYGIYGFSGHGREHVEFIVIKDLEEQLGDAVKRRIDKIAPIHGTRMGTALRHTITKLEQQEATTKVLMMLSDGRPQDRDYGRDPAQLQHLMRELVGPLALMRLDAMRIEEIADQREKEYAVHDTRMALTEARHANIIPFCLTVDKAGHDYLKTMCSDMGYEVLSDVNMLPQRLLYLYRRLTV